MQRFNIKYSSTYHFFTGESRHGLYNTHRLRYKGQVAQCSKCTAISLTVFVFSVIFLSSLSLAFIRPFDFSQECVKELPDFVEVVDENDYDYYNEEIDLTGIHMKCATMPKIYAIVNQGFLTLNDGSYRVTEATSKTFAPVKLPLSRGSFLLCPWH